MAPKVEILTALPHQLYVEIFNASFHAEMAAFIYLNDVRHYLNMDLSYDICQKVGNFPI